MNVRAECKVSITIVRFDEKVKDGLRVILNVDQQDCAWTQAFLPVSARVIGVRKSRDLYVKLSSELLVDAVLQNTGLPPSTRIYIAG